MRYRLWLVVMTLALPGSALAQPPVPPPTYGPIQTLPPLDLGGPAPPLPYDGCDPGVEGWSIFGAGSPPTALLFGLDLSILQPRVKNQIRLNDNTPSLVDYSLLSSSLDWAVSPRLEVGYRLADGQGEFLVGYRFLGSEGDENLDSIAVRSRLNLNVLDIVYQTERVRPFSNWYFRWRVGARVAGSFYDTRNIDGALTQSESSSFFGGGILGAFDLEYAFDALPGLALYTNVEGSVVLGEVEQNFHTTFGSFDTSATQRGAQAAQTVAVQLGLSYAPPTLQNWRFRVAYQFEEWFNLGKLNNSNMQLQSQGVLLRLEIAY